MRRVCFALVYAVVAVAVWPGSVAGQDFGNCDVIYSSTSPTYYLSDFNDAHICFEAGIYTFAASTSSRSLTIQGAGMDATKFELTSSSSIDFYYSVTLEDFTFEQDYSYYESISFESTAVMQNVRIQRSYGILVYQTLTARDCIFVANKDTYVIFVDAYEYLTLERCAFKHNYNGNVIVADSYSDIVVSDTVFEGNMGGWAIDCDNCDTVNVQRSVFHDNYQDVYAYSAASLIIQDSVLAGGRYGAYVYHSTLTTYDSIYCNAVYAGVYCSAGGVSGLCGTNPSCSSSCSSLDMSVYDDLIVSTSFCACGGECIGATAETVNGGNAYKGDLFPDDRKDATATNKVAALGMMIGLVGLLSLFVCVGMCFAGYACGSERARERRDNVENIQPPLPPESDNAGDSGSEMLTSGRAAGLGLNHHRSTTIERSVVELWTCTDLLL